MLEGTVQDYGGYQELKGWDEQPFMQPSRGERLFYDHYLSRLSLAGGRVLEVGFGNGNFLGWARAKGATVYGTEIQPAAIAKAEASGVVVLPIDLAASVDLLRGSLRVFAAIDVMEHLSKQQNFAMLATAAEMLERDGMALVRFPNGQSPLSMPIQHGDHTHLSVLSIPIVEQMAAALPFEIVYAGEPVRTFPPGALPRLARHAQDGIRRVATRSFRLIYGDLPLYANVVMVLRRR